MIFNRSLSTEAGPEHPTGDACGVAMLPRSALNVRRWSEDIGRLDDGWVDWNVPFRRYAAIQTLLRICATSAALSCGRNRP